MHKRRFLAAGALGTTIPWRVDAAASELRAGPGLLTVSGAIGRSNRGPLDPALDQLMVKHGVSFDRAIVFDAAMLERLPAVTIEPTLEYDAKPHRLSGPLLGTVLEAADIPAAQPLKLGLRALDGYTVPLNLAEALGYRMIVASSLDGVPMSLGGLGPLWAVYDADRLPAFKDRPLKERFAACPWGLYSIDVKPL